MDVQTQPEPTLRVFQPPQLCAGGEEEITSIQGLSSDLLPPCAQKRRLLLRRRIAGEVSEPHYAVMNQCRHCRGWERDQYSSLAEAVRNCGKPGCWLYTWRNRDRELSPTGEYSRLKVYDRERLPDEYPTVRTAIRNFCAFDCMGGGLNPKEIAQVIQDCSDLECHLCPWRVGSLDLRLLTAEFEANLAA